MSTAPHHFLDVRIAFVNAIRATLGFAPDVAAMVPGKFVRFPTRERGRDNAGFAKLFDDERGGVFGDMRSGMREVWRLSSSQEVPHAVLLELTKLLEVSKKVREAEQRTRWATNRMSMDRVWHEAVPLKRGDAANLYFGRRGIQALPQCMRLHPGLPYFEKRKIFGVFPTILAPLVAADGRVVGLHRTYLTSDGHKAAVPTPKKMMPVCGPLAGSAILLGSPRFGVIGIAEGIETALAAWCASGVPTVAAYCSSNIATWQWPAGTSRIVVFADHDDAGQEAAAKLVRRAVLARVHAQILMPSNIGDDWADVWLKARQENARRGSW